MSLTLVAVIFGALSLYSYLLVNRAGYVQQAFLIPFLYYMHSPKVLAVIDDDEHEALHDAIDKFNLRIISCFGAAVIGVLLAVGFILLAYSGGNPQWIGYIVSFLFAYLVANYNLNSSVVRWVEGSETELLARIMQNKSEEEGYDSLQEYLIAENEKMVKEAMDEIKRLTTEFMDVAEQCGYDPEKDYDESEETLEELFEILDKAQEIMNEKHPETTEK